jgi:hypothetical protein
MTDVNTCNQMWIFKHLPEEIFKDTCKVLCNKVVDPSDPGMVTVIW